MLKKIGFVLVASFSLAAVAQNGIVEGAWGRGILQSREGVGAATSFEVARFSRESEVRVAGRLHFASRTERAAIELNSVRIERLAVNGAVAEFAGFARGVVRTSDGPRRVEGRIQVRVQDRRREGQGDPDTFSITFANRDNSFVYNYAGLVRDGDFRVKDDGLQP
jgi:hypothetical protein